MRAGADRAVATVRSRCWLGAASGAALAMATLLVAAARPIDETGRLVPATLRVGFTSSSFTGVNEADARASFLVFARTMGERRGYRVTPEVRIFTDLEVLRAEIEGGNLQLVIMDSWDYLTIHPGPRMPIEFVAVEQGVVLEEYVLLVRSDNEVAGLADLAGRHLVMLSSTNANTGTHWLEAELMTLGYSEPRAFLGRYEVESKVSKVILPVFFGTADACVVDRSGLEVMRELNPQVGQRLRILRESEPLLDTVACVGLDGWDDDRQRGDLIGALQDIADDPSGRQIMNLFRFDRLTPVLPEYLESIRALHQRHDELRARLAGVTKAGSPGSSGVPGHE